MALCWKAKLSVTIKHSGRPEKSSLNSGAGHLKSQGMAYVEKLILPEARMLSAVSFSRAQRLGKW